MKYTWVYDIETLKSCFTYTALNVINQEIRQFVIHKDLNQTEELIYHLKFEVQALIGFNNIGFDYPVIHTLLTDYDKWCVNLESDDKIKAEDVIHILYSKAQEIISNQNNRDYNSLREKDFLIPQLDLFKLWHYNNKARSTSLKSLEIAMNYPNVMDMPIHHNCNDIQYSDIENILKYNLNDVLATYEFYKKSSEKIRLRKELSKRYNFNCINYPDTKIGEELILKLYCKETGKDYWEVKKQRTERQNININDCIFDYISFNTKEFQNALNVFRNFVVTTKEIEEKKNTKKKKLGSCIYKGFKYDFGLGGIHGCIKSGVYEADNDYLIIDADVASLYPNIAILNRLYPEHLGPQFIKVYKEGIVDERLYAKSIGDTLVSDALKLSANGAYGKSKDKFSFLYDPLYTLKTTINGQLMISMLCEDLMSKIEDITMLQVNTDGLTVKIHKRHVDQYYEICKAWEKITALTLEYVDYQKMIIGDVNNYIAVTTKGKVKTKGRFEIDKVVGSEPAYHKNNSFKIVPIALNNYFLNNIPIEETIINHNNIYDFCGRQKFKGDDYGEIHYFNNTDKGPELVIEKQQKNVRYYISKPGATFIKQYAKGTQEFIHVGYQVTIFNNYVAKEIPDYNINYQFYINECNKEIRNIIDNQLSLF